MMQELHLATDYALLATKVTVQALGLAMSTLVVQERHLWLNLTEIRIAEKAHFLYAPISQGGLFSDTVVDFAQQFLTVKKQTEAIKHILPRSGSASNSGPQRQQAPPVHVKGSPCEGCSDSATVWTGSQTSTAVLTKEGGTCRPINRLLRTL